MGVLDTILKVFVGDKSKQDIKLALKKVDAIKAVEPTFEKLDSNELRAYTSRFKNRIQEVKSKVQEEIDKLLSKVNQTEDLNEKEDLYTKIDDLKDQMYTKVEAVLDDILPEAFCVLKQTAKRFAQQDTVEVSSSPRDIELANTKEYVTIDNDKSIWQTQWDAAGTPVKWDMVHYDVQLIGGITLHEGKIAEMQTGEGKTLVGTLAVYLNALTGDGVHLVTVNDYLAKRDSQWMAPLFEFHGLSVDCIDYHRPNSPQRRQAYKADITYGTNNEFGFDYLRDNMASSPDDLVQRSHHYAIIDEVDSVLIDDARTPLIISGAVPTDRDVIQEFEALTPKVREMVQTQQRFLTGILAEAKKLIKQGDTENGGFKLLQAYRGIPKNKALIKFLSEDGIRLLLQKTENFYMQDNNREMHKVDQDLLYTIDEKSNLIELTDKGIERISMDNDPEFFILPEIATAFALIEEKNLSKEEEYERKESIYKDFSEKSERIHTVRQLLKAFSLFVKDIDYVVQDRKVMIVDEQTGRIMDGRRYSDGLHQAIEAKEQVEIQDPTQTFASVTLQNYFRMYRKLSGMTGTAITEEGEFWEIYKLDVVAIPTNRPIARKDKDDLVYKTQREKYNAVIDQVTKLSTQKRPVLVGTTSVEISELLSRTLSMRKIPHNVLNAKLHKKEADIVAQAGQPGMVTIATNMAGRGTDIKLSKEVKEAGGLAIIGTERHDSRRVDRQLRGRSGRQGDPGSSQFYVSLEDNLMRLFGSDKIAKMMDRMGHEEGEVIQHGMISKSIERAQKKVEENNFGTRKNLLEYDDVMNAQREVVYKRRRHALFGDRLQLDITNMIYDTIERIVTETKPTQDFKRAEFDIYRLFGIENIIVEKDFLQKKEDILIATLYKKLIQAYKLKKETIAQRVFPLIEHLYQQSDRNFERIGLPFSDQVKTLNTVVDLQQAYDSKGGSILSSFEKNITLAIIDDTWKTHLRKMDELKQSVRLAVHEQKDPLLIYKFEAFKLFETMLAKIDREVVSFLFKADLPDIAPKEQLENTIQEPQEISNNNQQVTTSKEEVLNSQEKEIARQRAMQQSVNRPAVQETIVKGERIGRNDKVAIKNFKTGQVKELKFKQAIPMLESGQWGIIKHSKSNN